MGERYEKVDLNDSFVSSKSLLLLFYFFVLLFRTSSSMLNKRGNNGHPCFVIHLKGKFFNVSPLYMFAVGFWRMLFIRIRKFPLIPNMLKYFLSLTGVKFYQRLPQHLL